MRDPAVSDGEVCVLVKLFYQMARYCRNPVYLPLTRSGSIAKFRYSVISRVFQKWRDLPVPKSHKNKAAACEPLLTIFVINDFKIDCVVPTIIPLA